MRPIAAELRMFGWEGMIGKLKGIGFGIRMQSELVNVGWKQEQPALLVDCITIGEMNQIILTIKML